MKRDKDCQSAAWDRMIEDMAARKLNPHTQRSHIYSCKRFAAWLKRSASLPRRAGRRAALSACWHGSPSARPSPASRDS